MLIPSHRHQSVDLEHWRELEDADIVAGRSARLFRQVERSLGFIRDFAADGRFYIGVSWGKDSVAAAAIALTIDPRLRLVNLRCTNRNPDCDAVRDEFLRRFSLANYEEVEVDYGNLHAHEMAHWQLDKATDAIWNAAIRRAGRNCGGRHLTGVRASESSSRLLRCRLWGANSPNGCAPLAWWSTVDVFAYLAREQLPVHPAYAMLGAGRWPRDRIRTAEIGDTHGRGGGRDEWEREYYGDVLARLGA